MNAPTRFSPRADFDLTALMRREGIREVRRDPLTDLFSVMLQQDWTTGFGATVGEALANAQRRTR